MVVSLNSVGIAKFCEMVLIVIAKIQLKVSHRKDVFGVIYHF